MIELKSECYSCGYQCIIGEREFIEDLQQCPNCDLDNIEVAPTGDSLPVRVIDPLERKRIVRRRMVVIGVISFILLLLGFTFTLIHPVFGITLMVVDLLCLAETS